jgi:predicted XRE-type DNA-binding protein
MRILKTNEKIIVWMYRNNITGSQIAAEIGITRQSWSAKLKSNMFDIKDLMAIQRLGYRDE